MKFDRILFYSLFLIFSSAEVSFSADKKDAAAAAPAAPVIAPQSICSTELTYKWKRLPPPPPPEPAAGKKPKAATPQEPLDPDLCQPIEAPALSLKESGPIEVEVKARLDAQLSEARMHAMNLCIELHQSQGTCLSKKLGAMSSQLDRMDFETKRAIREESVNDCKSLYGVCLSTTNSDITCRVEVVPTPAPVEAATKDPKKK